jgi:hypothetical protein
MKTEDKRKLGKKSRAQGKAFELKVRHDLEGKGWIVDRWSNNVEFYREYIGKQPTEELGNIPTIKIEGKLIPAKHTFNPFTKAMSAGNGFPDFICFKIKAESSGEPCFQAGRWTINITPYWEVQLVECKMAGKLDKIEKEKVEWYKNVLKIPVIIASKGEKRGEIKYE